MPGSSSDFVWALIEGGECDDVKALSPVDFNWRSLHPEHQITPLQVASIFGITATNTKFKQYLELVSWLISVGADPAQEAPASCRHVRSIWKDADRSGTEIKLKFTGASAIAVVVHCRRILEKEMHEKGKLKADWSAEISNLAQVLNKLGKTTKLRNSERMNVDVSVVDLWERMCNATTSHDVTFRTQDGVVTAHQALLSQASPVLDAMLSSGMREGQEKCIELKDISSTAMSFLLELLYTGSTCAEVDVRTALAALDLAHRWQIDGVVSMISRALEGLLADDNFGIVADIALLKGLPELRRACIAFAADSQAVQRQLNDGKLAPSVAEMLGRTVDSKTAVKKRRVL